MAVLFYGIKKETFVLKERVNRHIILNVSKLTERFLCLKAYKGFCRFYELV